MERFDAVLMDVQMPEMDGIEATRRIRQDARLARLPVIGLTAHAFADEKQRCLAVGMNDLVTKPIDPSRLFEAVARVLRTDSAAVRGGGAAPGARPRPSGRRSPTETEPRPHACCTP